MKIKIQITVESDKGQPEVVQEVAHLDRGILSGIIDFPPALGHVMCLALKIT